MNKFEKFLEKKGIIFEADDSMISWGPEHDQSRELIDVVETSVGTVILTAFFSMVLDPEWNLFDKDLKMIGSQDIWKDKYSLLAPENPWGSYTNYED